MKCCISVFCNMVIPCALSLSRSPVTASISLVYTYGTFQCIRLSINTANKYNLAFFEITMTALNHYTIFFISTGNMESSWLNWCLGRPLLFDK